MTSPLRHGFKAEAERIAHAVRLELNLAAHEPLDPLTLADEYAIPVVPLFELRADGARAESIARLLDNEAGFSALTLCDGTRRLIVFNPEHPPGRRANSVTHELSHVILEHPPEPAIGCGGCRRWNARHEAEADWLAGALLVPRDGALWWMRRGGEEHDGARHFGVSASLFRWRVHQTGVMRQLENEVKRYRRSPYRSTR